MERNRLVEHYANLVEETAGSVLARLPLRHMAGVEKADLVSAGTIGLAKAVERFDPVRCRAGFVKYAAKYAQGAMRDWLGQMDWARSARRTGEKLVLVTRDGDRGTKNDDETTSPLSIASAPASEVAPVRRGELLEQLGEGLEPQQRQLLSLHYLGGIELPQVALRMHMSNDQAMDLQRATVARLRERFEYGELMELLAVA